MMQCQCHDAEAMMDEVTMLEQALREAVERRRSGGYGDVGSPAVKPFDSAVATYGLQLRAWVDLQVDSRLNQVLPSLIEGELVVARQDAAAAIEVAERSEGEIRAVTDAQAKLLALVEGFSRELERTKAAVAARQLGAQQQSGQASASARDETLASLDKVRERLEEFSHSSRDRVEELARTVDDLARSSRERFEELARGVSRENESSRSRFSQLEEAFAELRRSGERQELGQAALQRVQQQVAVEGRKIEGLEREVAAASSARVDFEARLHARLETLRLEVAGTAGARTELESCVNRASAELDRRVESLIEARLEAWQFDSKLESRLGGLRSELEERLDSQSRVRLEAWRLESKQDFTAQLGETQEAIESQFRMYLEALRHEGRQELREKLQEALREVQERLEGGFRRSLEALRVETREEFKGQLDKSQARLGEDLVALQQRLVTELRAETTAVMTRESAAIAALDEQLWITDQRLGQRIDELAHVHIRGRISLPERPGGGREGLEPGGALARQVEKDREGMVAALLGEAAAAEERAAEQRQLGGSPRPESVRSRSLGLGVAGLLDGGRWSCRSGGSLAAASFAGSALMEIGRGVDTDSTEEPEDVRRQRSGLGERPRLVPASASAPARAPVARTASAPRLSPRSSSIRLYGDAWRGGDAASSERPPLGSAGGAATAPTLATERRQLQELQARRRRGASGTTPAAPTKEAQEEAVRS